MAAPLIRTKTPGIYKRGSRYVFSYRVAGKQHWESCRTLEDARRAKAARQTDIGRGEFEARSRITLHEFLRGWIDRYQGTGRRGFREETRSEYRGLLQKYALRYFPARLKLTELTPSMIAGFVAWLCDGRDQAKLDHLIKVERAREAGKRDPDPLADDAVRSLSDNTVRNAITPLRAALATARREGLRRDNPVIDVALPHRVRIEEDEDRPQPFPGEVMEVVVSLIHPKHRIMYELLAATGVRRSELLALEGRHLALDGAQPHIKIRQRVRRRRGAGLGPSVPRSHATRSETSRSRSSLRTVCDLAVSEIRNSSSRPWLAPCSIRTTSLNGCWRPRALRLVWSGLGITRFAIRSRHGSSRPDGIRSRSNAG